MGVVWCVKVSFLKQGSSSVQVFERSELVFF